MSGKKRGIRNLSILTLGLMLATAALAATNDDESGSIGVTFRGGAGGYVADPDGGRVWVFRSRPQVLGVAPDGPAAGVLEAGDIVISVDGHAVTTLEASRALQRPRLGQSLRVEVLRGDLPMTAELVAASGSTAGSYSEASEVRGGGRMRSWLGMGLEMRGVVVTVEKDGYQVYYFDEPPVVYTVDPGGPASLAGLQRGDVLLSVNGVRIDRDEGGELFSSAEPGEAIRLTFRRDDSERIATVVARDYADLGAEGENRLLQNLRYAGRLGDNAIEVRGLGRVVVSRTPDELVIRIDDATVTLSRDE